MKDRIDAKRLEDDARKSCCRESYIVLEKNSAFKLSAGGRFDNGSQVQLYLEVTLNLCPGKSIFNTSILENKIKLAKALKEMGYELACDEGQISLEKPVGRGDMSAEYRKLREMIEESEIFNNINCENHE